MQLQSDLPALEAAGIWPVALSYDSPATVAAFAAERGITHGAVELRANASGPVVRHEAAGVAIAVSLDSATYAPHQRVGVRARVLIADGAHVYGRPLPPGYTPLTLTAAAPAGTTVEAVAYPPPTPLPLPALGETLPVYTGAVELSAYVTGEGVREDVTIFVTLAWQVCTETDCLVPQTVTVSLPLRYRP